MHSNWASGTPMFSCFGSLQFSDHLPLLASDLLQNSQRRLDRSGRPGRRSVRLQGQPVGRLRHPRRHQGQGRLRGAEGSRRRNGLGPVHRRLQGTEKKVQYDNQSPFVLLTGRLRVRQVSPAEGHQRRSELLLPLNRAVNIIGKIVIITTEVRI